MVLSFGGCVGVRAISQHLQPLVEVAGVAGCPYCYPYTPFLPLYN
jgi:hypothetical protein